MERRWSAAAVLLAVVAAHTAAQQPAAELASEEHATAMALLAREVGPVPAADGASVWRFGRQVVERALAIPDEPAGRRRAFDLLASWARVARERCSNGAAALAAHALALHLAGDDDALLGRELTSRAVTRMWALDRPAFAKDIAAANAVCAHCRDRRLLGRARLLSSWASATIRHRDRLPAASAVLCTETVGEWAALAQMVDGAIEELRDHHALSAAHYGQARAMYRELGLDVRAALAGMHAANPLMRGGNGIESGRSIEAAVGDLERLGYPFPDGLPYAIRGAIREQLGREHDAVVDYRRALEADRRAGDRIEVCRVLHRLIRVLQTLGENEEEWEAYLAEVKVLRGDPDPALRQLAVTTQQDCEIDVKDHVARLTQRIRELEAQGRTVAAAMAGAERARYADWEPMAERLAACRRAVECSDAAPFHERMFAHSMFAACYNDAGDKAAAFDEYARCMALVEAYAREILPLGYRAFQGVREANHWDLDSLLWSLAQLPPDSARVATAFHCVQVFHGLGMAALRDGARVLALPEAQQRIVDDLRRQLQQVAEQRAAGLGTRAERDGLDGRAGRLARQIADAEDEGWIRSQGRLSLPVPRPATLDEVQRELGDGTALLEFVVPGPQHMVVVVTHDSCRFVPLGDISQHLGVLAQPKQTRLRAELHAALRALARGMLEPALAALPAGFRLRTLLIAPDQMYCRVPVEALLLRDVDPAQPTSAWPFAVTEYEVAYVHCGTMLRDLAQANREASASSGPDFVALAHPAYPDLPAPARAELGDRQRWGALTELPGTAEEALGIARLLATSAEQPALDAAVAAVQRRAPPPADEFVGARFRVLLQQRATETALRTDPAVATARILLLGCHAVADPELPECSHLSLAPSAADDGFVLSHELGALRLCAELVTLSACETNAGPYGYFEGTASLSRAILAAGARAVLASQWRVDDRAACDLMLDFHRRWLRDGVPRITALAQAKRQAIAEGKDVANWAAFQLWDLPPANR